MHNDTHIYILLGFRNTHACHHAGVVEEGRIYFLYRPRVNVDHPTSIDDIQRFFMILAPTSRPKVGALVKPVLRALQCMLP